MLSQANYGRNGLLEERRFGGEYDRTPTEATVEALAAAKGVDPIELPSLYDRIDTEAIDQLFGHTGGTAEDGSTVFGFHVDGLEVVIQGGYVRVYDPASSVDPSVGVGDS